MAILHFYDFKEIMVPNYIVIKISFIYGFDNMYKVKLDFKNRQDKNQLGFKNQINNDQLDQISFKNRQDKNNLTLRTKMSVTKNVLKVKFDCISFDRLH